MILEDFIMKRVHSGWARLDQAQKAEILEQARYRTFRRSPFANVRFVAALIAVLLVPAAAFSILWTYVGNALLPRLVLFALLLPLVLLAASALRLQQIKPQVRLLLDEMEQELTS